MITVIDRKSVVQAHAIAHFAELILADKERVDRVEMDFAENPEFVFELRCYIPEPFYSEYGQYVSSRSSFMEITGDSETCIENFDYETNDCAPTERQYTWLAISRGCCETSQLGWARDSLYDNVCLQETLATHEWHDVMELFDYSTFQSFVSVVVMPSDGITSAHAVLSENVSNSMAEI